MGCGSSKHQKIEPTRSKKNEEDIIRDLNHLSAKRKVELLIESLNNEKNNYCRSCKKELREENSLLPKTYSVAIQTIPKSKNSSKLSKSNSNPIQNNNITSINIHSIKMNNSLDRFSFKNNKSEPKNKKKTSSTNMVEELHNSSEEDLNKLSNSALRSKMETVQEVESKLELPIGDTPTNNSIKLIN